MDALKKKAIVVHSGGMDSSICLAQAVREWGAENVLSLSFCYGQRHQAELDCARRICREWQVDHTVIQLDCLQQVTSNALMDSQQQVRAEEASPPNTLVEGRNGLMTRLAAIHGKSLGAEVIYLGVIEVEAANSGYRDCTRHYMDLMEELLRLDLGLPNLEIRTPVVRLDKKETLELAAQMGVLDFLLENTLTCYEGLPLAGCGRCPACQLRNDGIHRFAAEHPNWKPPFSLTYKISPQSDPLSPR